MALSQEVMEFVAAFTGMKKAIGDKEDRAYKQLRNQLLQLQMDRITRGMAREDKADALAEQARRDEEEFHRKGSGAFEEGTEAGTQKIAAAQKQQQKLLAPPFPPERPRTPTVPSEQPGVIPGAIPPTPRGGRFSEAGALEEDETKTAEADGDEDTQRPFVTAAYDPDLEPDPALTEFGIPEYDPEYIA